MAESTPVCFGILGCANIARRVSRAIALAPNAAISAIGSRSIKKSKAFAKENKYPSTTKIYGSYEAVLDDLEVDAVYVPLPTSLHVKWAVLAAQKKQHVLLEKPVALNVKELDVILEECESNEVQFVRIAPSSQLHIGMILSALDQAFTDLFLSISQKGDMLRRSITPFLQTLTRIPLVRNHANPDPSPTLV